MRGGWNITQASSQTWFPGCRDHEVAREVRSVLQHATSLPLLLLAKVRRGGRHRRQEPLSQCLQIGRVKALGCTTGSTHPVKSILNDSVSQIETHRAGMDGEAIFFTGWGGAGRGKAKNLRGGAGRGTPPSPQCGAGRGRGQNLRGEEEPGWGTYCVYQLIEIVCCNKGILNLHCIK